MKIFLIADTHLGCHPLKLDYWLYDVTKKYFDDFFFPIINKYKQDGDIILHLGDFFDNRSLIPVNVLHYGNTLLKQMAELLPVHILLGNHDIYTEYDNSIHSMNWANNIKNVTLYENSTIVEFGTKKCLMLPWVQRKKDEINILNNTIADYVFCHSDLKGAYNNKKVRMKHGIDVKEFKKFKQVWSGHIHLRQKTFNFQFVGSPYHLDRNDRDDQKGIYILDTETGTYEFIPNNISPEYKMIEINEEKDLSYISSQNFDKDRIDLMISNKLLIENKKVRSKIEQMLQNNSFEQIKWKDDLKLDDVIDDEDMEFESTDLDINIRKLTYEYVNRQQFDSTDVKNKITTILDQMFEIYDDQKK